MLTASDATGEPFSSRCRVTAYRGFSAAIIAAQVRTPDW